MKNRAGSIPKKPWGYKFRDILTLLIGIDGPSPVTSFQLIVLSLILVALIIVAAFFSFAETSLMALNRYRLRHQARLKKRHAIRLTHLLKRPDRLLGAILIGNTFANMLASSLATLLAVHFWGDQGAILAAIAMTMVVLLFAEITPKTIAAIYPDQVARWVALPIQWTLKILYPMVWLANVGTSALMKLLHIRVSSQISESLSREELRSVVHDTTGKLSRQYQNMLLGILDLNNLTVDDVMVPREHMSGINILRPWPEILQHIKKSNAGWMAFYRGNLNEVVGVLYLKDVAKRLLDHLAFDQKHLTAYLQDPYFVPKGTPLSVQLTYFQQHHDHAAFVVDEYGVMQGVLTLNDILEEIIGDFTSSLSVGKRLQRQADKSYLVEGSMTVREFNRHTEFELPLRGPRTLNGLIIEHLEAMPVAGVGMLIGDYPVEIVKVKENRVKLARVFPRLHHREPHHAKRSAKH
jgi:Mg2+/Co2+ transporter CorB